MASALILALPAGALAQSVNPTDEQYGNGVLGVTAKGGSGGGSGGSTDPGVGIGELPFTGLDLVAIVAIGVGLLGAGFVIRRTAVNHKQV